MVADRHGEWRPRALGSPPGVECLPCDGAPPAQAREDAAAQCVVAEIAADAQRGEVLIEEIRCEGLRRDGPVGGVGRDEQKLRDDGSAMKFRAALEQLL